MQQTMMKKFMAAAILVGTLAACASYTDWRPVVDTSRNPNNAKLEQDFAECRALAKQAADALEGGGKGALVGALGGAAGGALLGAITGNAGMGAAIGASTGVVGGAAAGGVTADQEFKHAYVNCMKQRGHAVIN
jgi:outer membrane lipoprotein SlyB